MIHAFKTGVYDGNNACSSDFSSGIYIVYYLLEIFINLNLFEKLKANHGVVIVGYGTDPTTKLDYWIVRNSWSVAWGVNGYGKWLRGKNTCGIENNGFGGLF